MSTDVNGTLAALAIMPIMPVTVLASVHLIPQVKANFEQHMLDDWWMAKKNHQSVLPSSCAPDAEPAFDGQFFLPTRRRTRLNFEGHESSKQDLAILYIFVRNTVLITCMCMGS